MFLSNNSTKQRNSECPQQVARYLLLVGPSLESPEKRKQKNSKCWSEAQDLALKQGNDTFLRIMSYKL